MKLNRRFKNILTLFLSLCMIFTSVPANASEIGYKADGIGKVSFDHIYGNTDVSGINTNELFVRVRPDTFRKFFAGADQIFTPNTRITAHYDDVYILSCDSKEEARSVYSYYKDKVDYISDLSDIVTLAGNDGGEAAATASVVSMSSLSDEDTVDINTKAVDTETFKDETVDAEAFEAEISDDTAAEISDDTLSEADSDVSEAGSEVSEGGSGNAVENIRTIAGELKNDEKTDDIDYSDYIAVIDSGVSPSQMSESAVITSVSVIDDDPLDKVGHGSQMIDFIREEDPDAKILSIKAFDNNTANASDIYAAMQVAIKADVKVINLSFSGLKTKDTQPVIDVINEAVKKGIIVIGAAGNLHDSAKKYVAGCIEDVISVGALNPDMTLKKNSNFDADMYVAADSTSEAAARYTGIYTSGKKSDIASAGYRDYTENLDDQEKPLGKPVTDSSVRFMVKYLYVDKNEIGSNASIDDMWLNSPDAVLFQTEDYPLIYEDNGKLCFYADIPYRNGLASTNITDYCFANANLNGEVITKGADFNIKDHIATVDKDAFSNKEFADGQLQVMIPVDPYKLSEHIDLDIYNENEELLYKDTLKIDDIFNEDDLILRGLRSDIKEVRVNYNKVSESLIERSGYRDKESSNDNIKDSELPVKEILKAPSKEQNTSYTIKLSEYNQFLASVYNVSIILETEDVFSLNAAEIVEDWKSNKLREFDLGQQSNPTGFPFDLHTMSSAIITEYGINYSDFVKKHNSDNGYHPYGDENGIFANYDKDCTTPYYWLENDNKDNDGNYIAKPGKQNDGTVREEISVTNNQWYLVIPQGTIFGGYPKKNLILPAACGHTSKDVGTGSGPMKAFFKVMKVDKGTKQALIRVRTEHAISGTGTKGLTQEGVATFRVKWSNATNTPSLTPSITPPTTPTPTPTPTPTSTPQTPVNYRISLHKAMDASGIPEDGISGDGNCAFYDYSTLNDDPDFSGIASRMDIRDSIRTIDNTTEERKGFIECGRFGDSDISAASHGESYRSRNVKSLNGEYYGNINPYFNYYIKADDHDLNHFGEASKIDFSGDWTSPLMGDDKEKLSSFQSYLKISRGWIKCRSDELEAFNRIPDLSADDIESFKKSVNRSPALSKKFKERVNDINIEDIMYLPPDNYSFEGTDFIQYINEKNNSEYYINPFTKQCSKVVGDENHSYINGADCIYIPCGLNLVNGIYFYSCKFSGVNKTPTVVLSNVASMQIERSIYNIKDFSVSGAVYGLYDLYDEAKNAANDNPGNFLEKLTTDNNGNAVSANSYDRDKTLYLKELSAPEGFAVNSEVITVTAPTDNYSAYACVSTSDTTIHGTYTWYKKKYWSGADDIYKDAKDESGAEFIYYRLPSSDAKKAFSLEDYNRCQDDCKGKAVSDAKGICTTKDLVYGTYLVHQTLSTETYDTDDFTFSIVHNGENNDKAGLNTQNKTQYNQIYDAYIRLIKKDQQTNRTVLKAGNTYKIYKKVTDAGTEDYGKEIPVSFTDADGNVHDTFTTDENGEMRTFKPLTSGTYRLEEIHSARGYYINPNDQVFVISENGNEAKMPEKYTYEKNADGSVTVKTGDSWSFTTEIPVETDLKDPEGRIIGKVRHVTVTLEYPNPEVRARINIQKYGEELAGWDPDRHEFIYKNVPLTGAYFAIYADGDIVTPDGQTDPETGRPYTWFKDGATAASIISGQEVDFMNSCNGICGYSKDTDGTLHLTLPLGNYRVVELKAPDGYILPEVNEWKLSFTDKDGSSEEVLTDNISLLDDNGTLAVTNFRTVSHIKLQKKDRDTNEAVAGAVFDLCTADDIYNYRGMKIVSKGTVLKSFVTDKEGLIDTSMRLPDNSIASSAAVNTGRYYFTERSVSDSYYRSDVPVSFTQKYIDQRTGTLTSDAVVLEQQTKAFISKTNITGDEEVNGAHLKITDKDGREIISWITGDKNSVKISVDQNGTSDNISTDASVNGNSGLYANLTYDFDENGDLMIKGLLHDMDYTLTEVRPADGYVTAESIIFRLKGVQNDAAGQQDAEASVTNADSGKEPGLLRTIVSIKNADGSYTDMDSDRVVMKDEQTHVRFIKIDKETGQALKGAVFEVTDADGNVIKKFTTADDEMMFDGLFIAGQIYIFKEVKAPEGYMKAKDTAFKVQDTGEVQTITVKDAKKLVLAESSGKASMGGKVPQTGGITFLMMLSIIFILLTLALIVSGGALILQKRKDKDEEKEQQ
jgi:hypothetical protein